jgi:hypothetical protein
MLGAGRKLGGTCFGANSRLRAERAAHAACGNGWSGQRGDRKGSGFERDGRRVGRRRLEKSGNGWDGRRDRWLRHGGGHRYGGYRRGHRQGRRRWPRSGRWNGWNPRQSRRWSKRTWRQCREVGRRGIRWRAWGCRRRASGDLHAGLRHGSGCAFIVAIQLCGQRLPHPRPTGWNQVRHESERLSDLDQRRCGSARQRDRFGPLHESHGRRDAERSAHAIRRARCTGRILDQRRGAEQLRSRLAASTVATRRHLRGLPLRRPWVSTEFYGP